MNIDEMLSPPIPQLLYEPIQKDKVHPSQRRYFEKVGSMFTKHMAVHVDVLYKIHAIVKSKECTNRQLYYQYYGMSQPKPTCNKDFEYTLCSILHTATWADCVDGRRAHMIIRDATEAKLPSTYDGILTHPESNGLLNALLSECQS